MNRTSKGIRGLAMFLMASMATTVAVARGAVAELILGGPVETCPEVDIRRGYIIRDAISGYTPQVEKDLRKAAELGMRMVNLPRELNQFNPDYTPGKEETYNISYRSKGVSFFGGDGELEEFSRNAKGELVVQVNTQYVAICRLAQLLGLQVIVQCSGVPVKGNDDGSVEQLFKLDPTRNFHGKARSFPLPAASDREPVAQALFSWMSQLNEALPRKDVIWLGNQEPSHTAGYPDGVQDMSLSASNIADYAKAWAPVSRRLKQAGMLTGAIQLNEVRKDYKAGVEAIDREGIEADFFSIQNYHAERNDLTIAEASKQMADSRQLNGRKILFNRYNYKSASLKTFSQSYDTAAGIVAFLKAEKMLFDNADIVYGYNIFTGAQGFRMMDETFRFLNSSPRTRLTINGLGNELDAFALTDYKSWRIAVWNDGKQTRHLSIVVPGIAHEPMAIVQHGSSSNLTGAKVTWNAARSALQDITLATGEFVLISLQDSR